MIECYFKVCPHHGHYFGEEGPFCNVDECVASPEELEMFSEELRKERIERKWVAMCSISKPTDS